MSDEFDKEKSFERLLNLAHEAEIKKHYSEGLNYKELVEPTEEEMTVIHGYFTDFAVIQLLKLYAVSTYKDKSDFFLRELIALFISNMKAYNAR